ncbi:zinc finger SWIM domain-containing protein 1-like [Paramacrobiotus metropolitanus]|uniref:zinc finger SWIM domain-containing protein 1-like n=1 Tax=Paramacrobiotus metropolitanus TaxID=2943436 RepID=UPI0024457823|nr:zinc finger SWIM domain-containing protein 1-like [Paramacrobiotus metropolitanus]
MASELKVGNRYESYAEVLRAVEHWSQRTHQVFINPGGNAKTSKTHPLHDTFPYSSVKLVCKKAGAYRPHRRNSAPTKKSITTTLKSDCHAMVRLKLVNGMMEVIHVPALEDHNHEVTETIAQHFPERRRLSEAEKNTVEQLIETRVPPRIIAHTINATRRSTGATGTLITKDIFNQGTRIRMGKRQGREEHEILTEFLRELRQRDASGTFNVVVAEDETNALRIVFLQTTVMKQTFTRNPEVIFLDSTYRINMEHYTLYAMVVQDENGFGQPVAIGFVDNERADTLGLFFDHVKEFTSAATSKVEAIFVDQDSTQIAVLQERFIDVPLLICAFHAIKTWKFQIAKEQLNVTEKQGLLTAFRGLLYAPQEGMFQEREAIFRQSCTDRLRSYYEKNWAKDSAMWCMAKRRELRTFGNNTTNRIERFFLTVKTALRGSGRSIAKRFHLTECIEIVMSVIDHKANLAKYQDYINMAKTMILHKFPIPEIGSAIEAKVTDFAARVIRGQCVLYLKETYEVNPGAERGSWVVANTKGGRTYEVTERLDQPTRCFVCNCYINCSFGLLCRHIIHVRREEDLNLFRYLTCCPDGSAIIRRQITQLMFIPECWMQLSTVSRMKITEEDFVESA